MTFGHDLAPAAPAGGVRQRVAPGSVMQVGNPGSRQEQADGWVHRDLLGDVAWLCPENAGKTRCGESDGRPGSGLAGV